MTRAPGSTTRLRCGSTRTGSRSVGTNSAGTSSASIRSGINGNSPSGRGPNWPSPLLRSYPSIAPENLSSSDGEHSPSRANELGSEASEHNEFVVEAEDVSQLQEAFNHGSQAEEEEEEEGNMPLIIYVELL